MIGLSLLGKGERKKGYRLSPDSGYILSIMEDVVDIIYPSQPVVVVGDKLESVFWGGVPTFRCHQHQKLGVSSPYSVYISSTLLTYSQ